jgi:predicted nucleotide-binding protein
MNSANHWVPVDKRKVFVIHGRNIAIRNAVFDFLRAIGLSPIEWDQAVALTGKAAPYVGEILDAAFSHAQAVVVVLTGDDLARLRPDFCTPGDAAHETQLTPQARPNVLFEAGMALASHPDRTVLVQVGEVRPFSDIGGRHIIQLDNTVRQRHAIAQRLRTVGCTVDVSGTDWHTTGHFAVVTPRL